MSTGRKNTTLTFYNRIDLLQWIIDNQDALKNGGFEKTAELATESLPFEVSPGNIDGLLDDPRHEELRAKIRMRRVGGPAAARSLAARLDVVEGRLSNIERLLQAESTS